MTDASVSTPSARPTRILLRLAGDDRLAQLASRGDAQAFAAIFDRYHQPLYRHCRSILGNEEDAADALQNTMSKALEALAGERREIALKPWLYRIAHNESVTLLRRRRPESQIEAAAELGGPPLERTAAARDTLRQLWADLADLPERQRSALVMRELGGLSHAELAQAFSISEAAAKQTVFEARTALHQIAEGRAMNCETVRRALSDHDGRVLRGRRVRAHVRDCAGCRDFQIALRTRPGQLAAIAPPLPAIAAAGLLQSLLGGGGGGGGTGGGLFGLLTGGVGKAAGASAVTKGVAITAATVAVGGGAAGITAGVRGAADDGGTRSSAPTASQAQDSSHTQAHRAGRVEDDRAAGRRRSSGLREDERRSREQASGRAEEASEGGIPGPAPSPGPSGGQTPAQNLAGGDGRRPETTPTPPQTSAPGGDRAPQAGQPTGERVPPQATESPATQAPTSPPATPPVAPDIPAGGPPVAPDSSTAPDIPITTPGRR